MTTHPTALADQLKAASTEAEVRIRRAADHDPNLRFTHVTDTPAWLAELFERHAQALQSGHGRACRHLDAGPQVIHVFAWRPGWLLCPACQWLATPHGIEKFTCDRCGECSQHLWPGVAALGPILFGYALCHHCHTDARAEVER